MRVIMFVLLMESSYSPISLQGASLLVNLQASASGGNVPTATLDVQTLEDAREEDRCTRNRPLYVVLTFNNLSRKILDQMFQRSSSCEPRWLIFLDNASLDDTFRDVNIPFDCEFLVARPAEGQGVHLTEVYRVSRTRPLQTYPWGSWSPRSGIQGPLVGLYSRRNDLQGITIKALAKHNPPSVILKNGVFSGLCRSIFRVLERMLNFSLVVLEPEDKNIGQPGANGSWTGLIGALQRGEADVSLNALIQTSIRVPVMKFSQPIQTISNIVYIREELQEQCNWTSFLEPFSCGVWIAVLLSLFILTGVSLMARNSGHWIGNGNIDMSILCSFYNILHYVVGTFCLQGHWATQRPWSDRLVCWVSYVMAVTLWAAYSANLVAFLTKKPSSSLPFTSFKGLLDDESYQFIVLKESPYQRYFETTSDAVLRKLFLKKLQPSIKAMPKSILEGLERVCNGKVAFLCHAYVVDTFRSHLNCHVIPIPDAKHYTIIAGLGLRKGGHYNNIILRGLEDLRYTGVLKKLVDESWPETKPAAKPPFLGITFGQVAPIFAILTAAMLWATLIMLLRKLYRRCWQILFP